MEQTQNPKKYWSYFVLSLIVLILMMVFIPQFFWMALPSTTGFLAMAMDWI